MFSKFATWQEVLNAASDGKALYYHAPLDVGPRPVFVKRVFKNGKLRVSGGEISFTADADHLDRFYYRGPIRVVLEWMPAQYRESHRAAGNFGSYPDNGASRAVVSRDDAETVVAADDDGYARIVRVATPADVARYGEDASEVLGCP